MLNRPLYRALVSRFGQVRVTNEGLSRSETWDPREKKYDVHCAGEHYQVNCPFCGDRKHRLSISHQYVTGGSLTRKSLRGLANCYNQGCEQVYSGAFHRDLTERAEHARLGGLLSDAPELAEAPPREKRKITLPDGCLLLRELPVEHPARVFFRGKYPGLPEAYALQHNLMWCADNDPRYRQAGNRIIFPIYGENGKLISWQGRTMDPDVQPRWYNPPGFSKADVYNMHSVPPTETPYLLEGIPGAMACGPLALAVYSLSPSAQVIKLLAQRYSSVIIVVDADAHVPDNRPGGRGVVKLDRLVKTCNTHFSVPVRVAQWPEKILEQARHYCNGETDVKPPDATDLGMRFMRRLLRNV